MTGACDTQVCTHQNKTHQMVHLKFVHFLCKFYLKERIINMFHTVVNDMNARSLGVKCTHVCSLF